MQESEKPMKDMNDILRTHDYPAGADNNTEEGVISVHV